MNIDEGLARPAAQRSRTARAAGTRLMRWLALTAMVTGIAVGASAGPASAGATDRPKLTASHYDFGIHWDTFGAPLDGGYLYWTDQFGTITPRLTGYLYVKGARNECVSLMVSFTDTSGNWAGTMFSPSLCAGNSNGMYYGWIDITAGPGIASPDLDSAFIQLVHDNPAGGGWVVDSATYYE
jgi:hypothetical protein